MEQNITMANEELAEVVTEAVEEAVSAKSKFSFGKALGVSALVAVATIGVARFIKKRKAKKQAEAELKEFADEIPELEDGEVEEIKPIFGEEDK